MMKKCILLTLLLSSSSVAHAQMSESECYELQTEAYEHADSDETVDAKKQLDLSIKLTEECGYLMSDEVLKQRREYNYLMYKALNAKK